MRLPCSAALLLTAQLLACAPSSLEPGGAAAAPDQAEAAPPDGAAGPADGPPAADLASPPDAGGDLARAPDCSDGLFLRRSAVEWTLGDRTYPVGAVRHHCADLPVDAERQLKALVSVTSVNLGNASCGSLRMQVTAPSGKILTSVGAQPGVAAFYESGRWAVRLKNEYGCDRYRIMLVL